MVAVVTGVASVFVACRVSVLFRSQLVNGKEGQNVTRCNCLDVPRACLGDRNKQRHAGSVTSHTQNGFLLRYKFVELILISSTSLLALVIETII